MKEVESITREELIDILVNKGPYHKEDLVQAINEKDMSLSDIISALANDIKTTKKFYQLYQHYYEAASAELSTIYKISKGCENNND